MQQAQESLPAPASRAVPFHPEPLNQVGSAGREPAQPGAVTAADSPAASAPPLSGSFAGLGDNNTVIPPDTNGAVGTSHLMETLNDGVAFYDKATGAPISSVSLQAFWSSLGTGPGQPADFVFDPRVQYDQYSGRFIVTSDGGASSSSSWLLIAVSATSDPTGTWYQWATVANSGDSSYWADYPTLGMDSGHVYITANMFDDSGIYHQGDVWVISKAPLLSGNPTLSLFKDTGILVADTQPAHEYGTAANEYFASDGWSDSSGNQYLLVSRVSFDASGNPSWSNLGFIEVAPYSFSPPEAPQLGSTQLIDTGDTRLQNVVFRNGRLWTTDTVGTVDGTKTEAAWYELDPATASFGTPGAPVQQGRVSDPTRFYYYPSIAVNISGDAALGFSGSSSTQYASAYYTARKASDPADTMQPVALLKGGLASYYKTFGGSRNRWGDYSATVVDPSNDLGFWTLQEYASLPSGGFDRWGTWWGSFIFADTTPPTVTNVKPSGTINTTSTTISADYSDSGSGINTSSVVVKLDGNTLSGCTVTATSVSCPVNGLSQGSHTIGGSVSDNAGNTAAISGSFSVDTVKPTVTNVLPTGTINTTSTTISADYSDSGSGINTSSVVVKMDGNSLSGCAVTATSASCPVTGLIAGPHTIGGSVSDNAGNTAAISGSFIVDILEPTVTSVQPSGFINTTSTTISADYSDSNSGINIASVVVKLDGNTLSGCTVTATSVSCPVTGLTQGLHAISGSVSDNGGNTAPISGSFSVDTIKPAVTNVKPGGTINTPSTTISADYSDSGSGINTSSVVVKMDGNTLSGCTVMATSVSCPVTGLSQGSHTIGGSVSDNAGNTAAISGSFSVSRNYFWAWYDDVGGDDWVLLANPNSASASIDYSLLIGGVPEALPSGGLVAPGAIINSIFPGVSGGPVRATSASGAPGIVSQRSLWPKGGSSMEEVPATKEAKLSNRYFWTWYDQQSAGYTDWVLISNPASSPVFYRVKVAGISRASGQIGADQDIAPTFPGVIGGPVEVEAWSDKVGGSVPAKVMASQRVLTNNGGAFNEVPGTAASDLSSDYLWTWYDNGSPGATDWVLIANPSASADMYYEIDIAGKMVLDDTATGPIGPGKNITPTFPGTIGGPVEVKTFSNAGHTVPADSISSQRTIWGPSFEEVPGYNKNALSGDYYWTWYDMAEGPGVTNWVLIANPGASAVSASIKIAGVLRWSGTIPAGGRAAPTFPGLMGGPVEVASSGPVMASQRVLWNGYFNEVLGQTLL